MEIIDEEKKIKKITVKYQRKLLNSFRNEVIIIREDFPKLLNNLATYKFYK